MATAPSLPGSRGASPLAGEPWRWISISLVDADMPSLELRQADIVAEPIEPRDFDLVTARAVLHHVADLQAAVANLVASVRPGGAILLIEPDFLPVSVAEPRDVRAFWEGWLAWSRREGIDYLIGRRLPATLATLGMEGIEATAETALYNGGSPWAEYWTRTVIELAGTARRIRELPRPIASTRSSATAPIRHGGRRRLLSPRSRPAPPAPE